MKNKNNIFALIFTVIWVFAIYIFLWIYFYTGNKDIALHLQKIFPTPVNKDLVIVEIDDATLKEFGYPIERKYMDELLKKIWSYQPAVIAIDILFSEKSNTPITDTKLLNTFTHLGNVVLWYEIDGNIIKPWYFQDEKISYWYFNPQIDSNNNVYSVLPYKYVDSSFYESFSFQILRKFYNHKYQTNNQNLSVRTSQDGIFYKFFFQEIPLTSKHLFNIVYQQNQRNFTHYSFRDIYKWQTVDIKDKIVLIWYTSAWLDKFNIPNIGEQSGIYIHANTINNVLSNNYIFYFDFFYEWLISLLIIILIIFLNLQLKERKIIWLVSWAVVLLLLITFIYFLFLYFTKIPIFPNNTIWFIWILFLSFFGSAILKYMIEDKNKRLLSDALSAYVSSDIAREILYSSWNVNLSWENKKITMFFSDIAWFTTISEKLSPEELVSFLRVYLGEMSHIIMDNKWFINKYEWDAIMALWWVFWKVENYGIIDGCKSALLQQTKLKVLNEQWKLEWKEELSVRMGLHTWPAIIGNIWAEGRKMEFTALWDSVNLASRLEGVNKFYGTHICVSEDIYNEAKEIFTFRYLDKIKVKWKNIGINIYELVSYIWEAWIFKENIIADFEKAVDLYMNKKFLEAKEIFEKLAKLWDNPSKVYYKRCEIFLQTPPNQSWDGIWTMDEK